MLLIIVLILLVSKSLFVNPLQTYVSPVLSDGVKNILSSFLFLTTALFYIVLHV